jgi:hypothetical protein
MGVQLRETDQGHMDLVNDADATVLMKVGGTATPTVAAPYFSVERHIKMPLTAGTDTGGGIASWQNPYSYDLIVTFATLDVTTIATGACSLEVGETASSGTTAASNLISSQDVHSATGCFNSGAKSVVLPAGKWITVSTVSGASAGLVGNLHLDVVLR